MKNKSNPYLHFRNLHLITSLLIVVPTALNYGLFPSKSLPILLDFEVDTVDLTNVFRAIMGLYLSISWIWFLGIMKSKYWQMATILNIVFMAGLAFGRIMSLVIDGMPSPAFLFGLLAELALTIFGAIQLRKNTW